MAWQYDPIGAGWITGTTPALADFQHIEDDIQTWGGNVNAGGHQLTNCAAVLGAGGGSLYFSSGKLGVGTSTPASLLNVDGGQLAITNAGATSSKVLIYGGTDGGNSSSIYIYDGSASLKFFALSTGGGYFGGSLGVGTSTPTVSGTGKVHFSGDTARIVDAANTPANSAATGNDGEVRMDSSYIYIHTGGSWRRAAVSTF